MKSKKTLLAAALERRILTAGSPVLAQDMTFFRIASGSADETYYPMAGLLAQVISNPPGARTCAKWLYRHGRFSRHCAISAWFRG